MGTIVLGCPAVENQLYLRVSAIYQRLPEMDETFKEIKKQLINITALSRATLKYDNL